MSRALKSETSSNGEDVSAPQTIIVVRRGRGGQDEGHHGGVWKIAYADFMTAMMAFFLVMWLVNSADQQTIVQVAAYFNPIRLSDKVPSNRGLHDGTLSAQPVPDASSHKNSKAKSEGQPSPPLPNAAAEKRSSKKLAEHEERLFSDPQKTLNELAAAVPPERTVDPHQQTLHRNFKTNHVLPDPFDLRPADDLSLRSAHIDKASGETVAFNAGVTEAARVSQAEPPANAAANALIQDIQMLAASRSGPGPDMNVRLTPEGVLLSISDDANFSMFAVGSAEPRPELIVLMGRLAEILQSRGGEIVIRGHTDNRPFKSATYDNWRLSSARASMAYHMLLRGGIPERRIGHIEGYADRKPRNELDRGAAENRRIDIMLKIATP
jgi:chemotaxis protein MotB